MPELKTAPGRSRVYIPLDPDDLNPQTALAPRLLVWSSGLYLAAVLVVWLLIVLCAEHWWPATLLLFGPRWLLALPGIVLVLATAFMCRRWLWLPLLALVLVLVPFMGLCVALPSLPGNERGPATYRVLTCNVHRRQLDTAALAACIAETRPDIVALQDWSGRHGAGLFEDGDWHLRRDDELLLASRFPIQAAEPTTDSAFTPGRGALVRYELDTPIGTIRFFNLHLASPHEALNAVLGRERSGGAVLQANSTLRWRQSAAVVQWAREQSGPVLFAGDFNTPPDSPIYRTYWSQFTDAFGDRGLGWGVTYRTRRTALRIDHILAGPGWECRRAWVGPAVGSPHRPVIADLRWSGPAVSVLP
jgi:endonuclease/exonuclease/phosphatase family metal-dependent hydrolase